MGCDRQATPVAQDAALSKPIVVSSFHAVMNEDVIGIGFLWGICQHASEIRRLSRCTLED